MNAFKNCARALGACIQCKNILTYRTFIKQPRKIHRFSSAKYATFKTIYIYICIESRLYCGYDIICCKQFNEKSFLWVLEIGTFIMKNVMEKSWNFVLEKLYEPCIWNRKNCYIEMVNLTVVMYLSTWYYISAYIRFLFWKISGFWLQSKRDKRKIKWILSAIRI